MARIAPLEPGEASGMTKELLDLLKSRMGMLLNNIKTLGNSPAALTGYLGFNAGMRNAAIGPQLEELIALTVAYENSSAYCGATHSYIASQMGFDWKEINDARMGISIDPKVNAALGFAKDILRARGALPDETFRNVRAAGFTEGEIVEIIAQVSLSIFTNYVNNAASTDIDLPD